MSTRNLLDLPIEVFLDQLFPAIQLSDLLSLSRTCKFFAILCSDDTFWKRKLREDFNYSITDARNKGFRLLYRGIRRPHVYVWGSQISCGRLGLATAEWQKYRHQSINAPAGIPFPVELNLARGVRIVTIVAPDGFYFHRSFHALDDTGKLHVWGTMDSERMSIGKGEFADAGECASTPVILDLPESIVSLSAGRKHVIALDAKGQVWLFTSWGRPARILSPVISDTSSAISRVVQAEAGWYNITVLTDSGTVYVEWPFGAQWELRSMRTMRTAARVSEDRRVPCEAWDLHHDLFELPPIPQNLPTLRADTDATVEEDLRLIKIAAGDQFLVGLTNRGHVLRIDLETDDGDLEDGLTTLRLKFRHGERKWEYLPQFSELKHVREHPTFSSDSLKSIWTSENLGITHISASFQTFVAYSVGGTSVVLMGKRSTSPADVPTVLPGLQNRNIISVVLGDYHFGALTEDGTLLTWGKYSAGAIGLGDPFKNPVGSPGVPHRGIRPPPRDVQEPTEVRFDYQDHKRDKFVFSVAASGWHTAALVIDLEPNNPPGPPVSERETPNESTSHANLHTHGGGRDEEDGETMPGAFPRVHLRGGPGPFRIGYAGRGLAWGAALQSHVHQQPGAPDVPPPQPQPHNTAPWTGRVLHGGFRGLPPRRGGPRE
ncbi:hypothetical protein BS47DRAFT_1468626 [Hydnum rufescens UP504]|uniref:F-box domain-containing protein n=1 Tax=Hydnum rufescens UP504 TaxID=1448309 RepID=A0A9P6B8H5_9AGAM|nr:hypothetical protein BS47DRAFT_1468626 [Hydnum rufescens UP504]